MLLSLRSRSLFQPLPRVCCGLLSALLVLAAPASQAAAKKTSKTSKSSKTGAKAGTATPPAASTPEPAAEPKPAPAPVAETKAAEEPARPAPESKPAPEPRPAAEPKPTASRSSQATRAAAAAPEAPSAPRQLRVGVGPDLYLDGGQMTGVQNINTAHLDESFGYTAGFVSATAWLSTPVPSVSERVRVGAGLRLLGNYTAAGGQAYGFGLLNELFVSGEYGLPVASKMEVVFAGRAGLSFLIPGLDFASDIQKLQAQGVNVWSVPRVGWLLGPSVGARRQMSERIWLRADILGQIGQQYLFATSQEISGLNYSKNWSTLALRLGLSLGAEFSL